MQTIFWHNFHFKESVSHEKIFKQRNEFYSKCNIHFSLFISEFELSYLNQCSIHLSEDWQIAERSFELGNKINSLVHAWKNVSKNLDLKTRVFIFEFGKISCERILCSEIKLSSLIRSATFTFLIRTFLQPLKIWTALIWDLIQSDVH